MKYGNKVSSSITTLINKFWNFILQLRKAKIDDAQEIMDLMNETYGEACKIHNFKWRIGHDQMPRIGSIEIAKEMIATSYIARNKTSNEIIGVVVIKVKDVDIVEIGPVAVKPKFKV